MKAFASALCAGVQLESRYSIVSSGVPDAINSVMASSSAMDKVMSLLSRSSASFCLSVRTICGTSTALNTPVDSRLKITCGICAPA